MRSIFKRVSVRITIIIVSLVISGIFATYCPNVDAKDLCGSKSMTIIQGELSQVSKLPVAKNNPYPDCYYTAVIDIAQIICGQSIQKKAVLVLPGFFSRQYAPEANYKVGDKVRATVVPFASKPDKVRQTQQADEIEDLDLTFYYPETISLIEHYEKVENQVPFATNERIIEAPSDGCSVDLEARAARQQMILHDLEEINSLLAKHGGNWDKWYDSLKGVRTSYKQLYDAKAQKWVGDSFFGAGEIDDGKVYSTEFIKSLIDFKNYLAARNVDLIVVRVPKKGEIAEDLFTPVPQDRITNPYLLRMYKELLEADVEVITDIIPVAKSKRLDYPLMYWYQDRSEIHPAEGISWVIAEEFAKRASRYKRVKSAPRQKFGLTTASTTEGWLAMKWPAGNPKFNASDLVSYSSILDDKGTPLRLAQNTDSPIFIVGSSFVVSPSLPKGATIPHYFAYLTGITPDLLYRNAADVMIPRSIAREGDRFLEKRSVCLFPFVPGTAYSALASLPLFDAARSTKDLLATMSGPSLSESINFSPGTHKDMFFYSSDGVLSINPKEIQNAATFTIKAPRTIRKYSHFILSVECSSYDRSSFSVNYSGQTDTVKRSDSQPANEEMFIFSVTDENELSLTVTQDKWLKTPIKIKSVKFFGVTAPKHHK